MSRSYKKHPFGGDKKNKFAKRYSNHVVRRKLKNENLELQNMDYKRIYCSWDICDYWSRCTWEEYWEMMINRYYRHKILGWKTEYPDKKKSYQHWLKYYRRK